MASVYWWVEVRGGDVGVLVGTLLMAGSLDDGVDDGCSKRSYRDNKIPLLGCLATNGSQGQLVCAFVGSRDGLLALFNAEIT